MTRVGLRDPEKGVVPLSWPKPGAFPDNAALGNDAPVLEEMVQGLCPCCWVDRHLARRRHRSPVPCLDWSLLILICPRQERSQQLPLSFFPPQRTPPLTLIPLLTFPTAAASTTLQPRVWAQSRSPVRSSSWATSTMDEASRGHLLLALTPTCSCSPRTTVISPAASSSASPELLRRFPARAALLTASSEGSPCPQPCPEASW